MRDLIETLTAKLDESQSELSKLDSYFEGRQPAAFLSPKSQEALAGKLRVLSVGYSKLLVDSIAERLRVTGFTRLGEDTADASLWRIWERNNLAVTSHLAHVDALLYGRSFAIVWAGADGEPLVTVESPKQMAVLLDPATNAVVAAVKVWSDTPDGLELNAVLYEADEITRFTGREHSLTVSETIKNPLGEVPVVPIVNRHRLLDVDGSSEINDIADLVDALNKTMSDAMVTSEYFARPRRFVTGLEIVEDDDGNVVNPFSNENDRVWQSEDPATKFGQFDAARLDGYADLGSLLTQQIGAISGLPAHYLGLNGDQPPSAESIRSAEASLVAKVQGRQRIFGRSWAKVADLVVKVRDGQNGSPFDVHWSSAETRTPSQATDSAVKLHGMGVPLEALLSDPLGYTPAQIARITSTANTVTTEEEIQA